MQKKTRWGGGRKREREVSVEMERRRINRFELHMFQDLILSPESRLEN